jgi:flagellar biogenesis protein FliO
MRFFYLIIISFCMPAVAHAYVGPGAGIGAVVVTLALVLGLILLVVGFLWYPIKRVMRGRKSGSEGITNKTTEV